MRKTLLISTLFTAGLAGFSQVHAACTTSSGFTSIDIPMNVGRIVVRPTDEVGKILKKASFPIAANDSEIRCNANRDSMHAELVKSYPISALGQSIYSTNIPGIGIRLYREAPEAAYFSGYYPYTRTLSHSNNKLGSGDFVVEIIKTSEQTGSGALVPGRYSTYYGTGLSNRPFLTSTVYGNTISVASSSCELMGNINKSVQLPFVSTSDFKGVGSTQGEQDFDLNIVCNGGNNPAGIDEKNLILLAFDYTQEGNNNQVLSNTAPNNSKANGVGVQLLSHYQNNHQVIAKGGKLSLGTVNSNQSILYHIPLSARYYQTANTVTSGLVRATATVTIEYN